MCARGRGERRPKKEEGKRKGKEKEKKSEEGRKKRGKKKKERKKVRRKERRKRIERGGGWRSERKGCPRWGGRVSTIAPLVPSAVGPEGTDAMAASSSSSSGEQQYSLRWNDFHSSILSSFRHLRDEEDFVDVTLACDSSSFTAHKVVLSACSPYFRRLLKANPCQHPIVILRDVASSDMESLLRFMYHGEVHVGQEQLAAFLKTAQMLQVRGLADVNSGAATAKIPPPSSSGGNNGSAPATPRNPWQDNGRGDLNESGLSPPPDKRPRSYSPPLGNHIEPKTDLQESLLGQALEGGPTIHTTPTNNVQAQSTGEDSNSMSDNEEDMSNNDSILNSVKTEPSDILNDSMEHHRSTFPAALLGLQGNPSFLLHKKNTIILKTQ